MIMHQIKTIFMLGACLHRFGTLPHNLISKTPALLPFSVSLSACAAPEYSDSQSTETNKKLSKQVDKHIYSSIFPHGRLLRIRCVQKLSPNALASTRMRVQDAVLVFYTLAVTVLGEDILESFLNASSCVAPNEFDSCHAQALNKLRYTCLSMGSDRPRGDPCLCDVRAETLNYFGRYCWNYVSGRQLIILCGVQI